MDINVEFKKQVYQKALSQLVERMEILKLEISEAQKASSEDTKSSAGDKYETGRAMLNLEKERFAGQLQEANKLFTTLTQLNQATTFDKVQSGSLVETSMGIFYLSAAIGQIQVDEQRVYCISSYSPIGKALIGATKNTEISFQNRFISILEVC